MALRIDVENEGPLRELDAQLRRLADLKPALEILADIAQEGFTRQFETGKGWPALAKSTIAEKGNNRKLVNTGSLRNAMTRHPERKFYRASVTVGVSSATYPEAFHLKFGDRGMKKRNPAKVDTKWVKQEAADRLLRHFVNGGLRGPLL